jgi:uncharacterized SAM-binding protein YcdF (DUF218 family)
MNIFLRPLTEVQGILWLVLWTAVAWHLWRRQWRRAIAPAVLAVTLSGLGNPLVARGLMASLERPYASADWASLKPADAVVMLGGVLDPSANDVFRCEFGDTVDRVITAAELVRQGKGRALVLGGDTPPAESGFPSEGQQVKTFLGAWGLTNAPVFLLGNCRNTHDEALRVQELVRTQRWERLILLTSASHMKRAEAIFRKLDLPVTCVACDFKGLGKVKGPFEFTVFPCSRPLELVTLYLHEKIGWCVYRLRGWVK